VRGGDVGGFRVANLKCGVGSRAGQVVEGRVLVTEKKVNAGEQCHDGRRRCDLEDNVGWGGEGNEGSL
jgi:hypothetical protein